MKIKFLTPFLFVVLGSWLLAPASGFAKPEHLQIKDANKQVKERSAQTQIKNIDLRNIEDPEARKAITEILNYLNLQTRN